MSRRSLRHDLLAPLSSIQGFADILLSRQLSQEDSQRYLTIIRDEAKRLATLIESAFEDESDFEAEDPS